MKRFILISVIAIAVIIRLYFVFTHERPFFGDQYAYDKLAVSLWQRHEYAWQEGRPTAYVTPLYPLFLSGVYAVFGHSYLWAKVVQAFLGAFTCLIIYFISKEIFGRPVAVLAIFLMAIHHFFVSYGILLNSENLFIFFVALNVLSLVKFYKSPSYKYAVLFGVSAALAALTRSAYLFFPFMAIACLGVMRRPAYTVCIAACVVLPMSIWTARNFLVLKAFVPVGTEAGIVFYSAYNPKDGKVFDKATQDEVTWKYPEFSEVEGSRFLLRQTLLSIKKEPSKLYKYIPVRLMYFFSVFDWHAFKEAECVYNFSTAFILPLGLMGAVLAFCKRPLRRNGLLLLLPLIYFVLVTAAVMGVPRTRMPVEPYLIIFAAFFMHYIYTRARLKAAAAAGFFGWYAFNLLLYLNSGPVKETAKAFFQKAGLW